MQQDAATAAAAVCERAAVDLTAGEDGDLLQQDGAGPSSGSAAAGVTRSGLGAAGGSGSRSFADEAGPSGLRAVPEEGGGAAAATAARTRGKKSVKWSEQVVGLGSGEGGEGGGRVGRWQLGGLGSGEGLGRGWVRFWSG